MLRVFHTQIAIADILNAMGLIGLKSVRQGSNIPANQYCKNPLVVVVANTHVVTAPSHMHLEEPSALLKTPPAKVVGTKVTGDPDARVMETPNSKRQNL